MKISKLFHWLYASVMMLPLIIAPIFAIAVRSDNNFQPIEIQVVQDRKVVFNQMFDIEHFTTGRNVENVVVDGTTISWEDTNNNDNYIGTQSLSTFANHKFYVKVDNLCEHPLVLANFDSFVFQSTISAYSSYEGIIDLSTSNKIILFNNETWTERTYLIANFQCFDLTRMFGDGYEPSVAQFNQWYPNDYYSYNIGETQLLKNYSTEILNDTDLGSQFVYSIYKPLKDYFNVNNFLGFNNLYDWINLNIFNGNASLGFNVFYILLSYWLMVSIFWLVFDVAMYVPKLAHRWLDKASFE